MQIATKEVQLTKGEYCLIIASDAFRRTWFISVALGVALVALTACVVFSPSVWRYWVAVLFVTPLWPTLLLGTAWQQARSPKNKIVYERRRFEFDDDFIKASLGDGSYEQIRYDHVTTVVKSGKHYLLQIAVGQFIWIPFRAFLSGEDMDAFDALLRSKNLL